MTLRSAYQDFVERTLAALPNCWRRLEYVAGLRKAGGGYSHWGMERVYGERQTQQAIAEAHRELLLGVLRTPLATLAEEAEGGDGEAIEVLRRGGARLLPEDMGGGSAQHFNSIVSALSALATSRSRRKPAVA